MICKAWAGWLGALTLAAVLSAAPQHLLAQHGSGQRSDWSVNTSLPSEYNGSRPRTQRAQAKPGPERSRTTEMTTDIHPEFGRIPVQSGQGSIGFTSGSSASSGRFHDGRDVPGLNPNAQKESSFVGLSMSVSSGSKGLPVPVPTPWNRHE
jgi:hypothetical protein